MKTNKEITSIFIDVSAKYGIETSEDIRDSNGCRWRDLSGWHNAIVSALTGRELPQYNPIFPKQTLTPYIFTKSKRVILHDANILEFAQLYPHILINKIQKHCWNWEEFSDYYELFLKDRKKFPTFVSTMMKEWVNISYGVINRSGQISTNVNFKEIILNEAFETIEKIMKYDEAVYGDTDEVVIRATPERIDEIVLECGITYPYTICECSSVAIFSHKQMIREKK